MFDLIIKGATIVNETGTFQADIAVADGKIAEVGQAASGKAARVIEAAGQYVLPGLIDMHTHFQAPFMGCLGALDFYTGSIAAAFGGVTTFIDFTNTKPGDSVLQKVKERREEMEKAVIDYSVHAKFVEATDELIGEIPAIVDYGCTSIKMFTTYRQEGVMIDDDGLLKVFAAARKFGVLPGIHAESNAIAEYNIQNFKQQNLMGWKHFPDAKPPLCELEAVQRGILLARVTGSPLYIFHLTSSLGLEAVRAAQNNGQKVFAETCPHYLLLTKEYYERDDGYKYVMSPPLREEEDRLALWQGLADGNISIVSSDDCTYSVEEKTMFLEKKGADYQCDFTKVANGVAGTETRLSLLAEYGLHQNRLTLPQLVAALSANPAKLFGMYPEKGTIQKGSIADLVIFDKEKLQNVSAKELHQNIDYSIYEGREVTGWPVMTIAHGKIIVENGRFTGERGQGSFVKRKPFAY